MRINIKTKKHEFEIDFTKPIDKKFMFYFFEIAIKKYYTFNLYFFAIVFSRSI